MNRNNIIIGVAILFLTLGSLQIFAPLLLEGLLISVLLIVIPMIIVCTVLVGFYFIGLGLFEKRKKVKAK